MPGKGKDHRFLIFGGLFDGCWFSSLAHFHHIILNPEGSEASDEAGKAAEAVLLHVKAGEGFLELFVDDA